MNWYESHIAFVFEFYVHEMCTFTWANITTEITLYLFQVQRSVFVFNMSVYMRLVMTCVITKSAHIQAATFTSQRMFTNEVL